MRNSKKLLALLTALSISTSAFAGFAPIAGAATEDDILWSDTFNGAATGVIANGTDSGSVTNSEYINGLTFVTGTRGSGDRGWYTATDGSTIKNGSYYEVMADKADATDKYVRLSYPVFADYASNGRWAYVTMGEGYTATAEKDVVMDFDLKITDAIDKGVKTGADTILRIGTFDTTAKTATAVEISKTATAMGDDWVDARIIVSDSNGAKLYINGAEVADAANASVKSLTTIGLYSADGVTNSPAMTDLVGNSAYDDGTLGDPTKLTQTALADIDNLIIYNEAAGVATGDSLAPGAQEQEGGATPEPEATPRVLPAGPELTAPEGVTGLETYNFDDLETKKWTLGTEVQSVTDIEGLTINVGARASGGNVNTYASVAKLQTGNALEIQASEFSTAARAPRVAVNTSMPVADGVSTAMTLNVYLSTAKNHEEDGKPRLYFLKDATQAGDDGAGAYRNVAAVITSVQDEVIYRGDDTASDVISAYVTPDEWHTVTFVVTYGADKNTHRVFIDGAEEAAIKVDYVATGENASSMDNLPMLTTESQAGTVGGVDSTPSFSNVTIDNLMVYQGSVDEPRKLAPAITAAPTPEPTPEPVAKVEMTLDAETNTVSMTSDIDAAACLIVAAYDENGAFVNVKSAKEVSLKANTAVTETVADLANNDKIMLWSNLTSMLPFAETITAVIAEATEEPTPSPTAEPTPTPTPAPTARPEVDPSLVYYTQDYQADGATIDWTTATSGRYTPMLQTDGTNVWAGVDMTTRYNNGTTITSPNYSSYVSGKTEYVLEFDAAIGYTNGSQKPTFNVNTSDGYLLRLTTENGTDWVVNGSAEQKLTFATTGNTTDVSTATAASTSTWYNYTIIYKDGDTHLMVRDMDNAIVFGPEIIISGTKTGALSTLSYATARYYANFEIDNVRIRGLDEYDVLGERGEETMNDIVWLSELNTTITQPAEGEPVQKPLQVKVNGIYGNDLTNKEGVEVTWDIMGLDNEDGYISLTKDPGTESGTTGEDPTNSAIAYFNVRNGVSNWFGQITATVKYLDKELSITTPFAVIGANTPSTNLAPLTGYPVNMSDYDDSLVGFVGASNAISSQDLVLNSWSMYGSNGTRSLSLAADEDGTKYLRFAINGGSGSAVPVYQLAEQTQQYIVDMKVRFTGGDVTFGHYFNTPNNSNGNPNWTASYGSGALTVGTQSISGLSSTEWYRIVISADEVAGTSWAKVYDNAGTLVGEIADEALLSTATETQKYFCFQGAYPVDLASFRIYYPTAATLTVNSGAETVQVPEDSTPAEVSLTGVLKDTDGYTMTGALTWSLAEEYAGVTIVSDGAQGATLSVTNEAGSGAITVVATYGATRVEKQLTLSTSGNSMVFTQFNSSLTIPFAGEDNVTASFAAEARNKDGQKIDSAVTYEMVDASGEAVTNLRGVTFDPATCVLTVEAGAASKVVYIKATTVVEEETLTSRVKVNIHGLSFAFGSDAPTDDSYTQVTSIDAYTEKLGYGFADTSVLTDAATNVVGTADYRFKAKVPNGNYIVNVTTSSATMTSEVVETVTAVTGISKSGSQFKVAVCDGVLDLTFLANSTLTDLTITQDAAKEAQAKPSIFAIGDSTTNNSNNARSWGNCVGDAGVTLPEAFTSFSNNGMAGRDSVNFYNQGRVEAVLLNICPGDYVTVNMGINSKETNEAVSYYTLMDEYYVNGIIQRGGIPVIVTATPQGPVGKGVGNYANGVFTCNRGTGAHNGDLRKIAVKYDLNIIELGYWGDDYFNSLTEEDVTEYNAANSTSFTTVLELVQSWYPDHNHYHAPLGNKIANYILDCLDKIEAGSADFHHSNDPHINEQ